jgi:hypothetical protein
MSRGLSWRQHSMLESILRRSGERQEPVALRDIDYGPTALEGDPDYSSARNQWNIEQAMRRALRSLERRGLVTLARYVFFPEPVSGFLGSVNMRWAYTAPDNHVPGDSRIMLGALLTDAGRALVKAR